MSCDYIHDFFKNSDYTCSSMSPNVGIGVSINGLNKLSSPVYIFATRQGWVVDSSGIGFSVDAYSQSYTVEEACKIAKGIVSCEYLPITPEDIEISVLRSQGTASQKITHKPTGVIRWIKDATGKGAIVNRQKEDALHQIVLELAEIAGHNKA